MTTKVHICDVCDAEYDELTRAVHDTFRELASAAGLALWVHDVLSGEGLRVDRDEPITARVDDLTALYPEVNDAD